MSLTWNADHWLARDARLHGTALIADQMPDEAVAELHRVAGNPKIGKNPDSLVWLSVVNSYLVTEKVLTLGGRKHKVVVHGGSYGVVGDHPLQAGETAANTGLSHTLAGPGLRDHGNGMYQISVSERDTVKIVSRMETIRRTIEKPRPTDTRPPDTKTTPKTRTNPRPAAEPNSSLARLSERARVAQPARAASSVP